MINRIDVHHHGAVPSWIREVEHFAPGRPIRPWTPGDALRAMDHHQVARAVVSLTAPGIWFGDAARAIPAAHAANEELAAALQSPESDGRLDFFAALPLPDVEATLAEIEHASDLGCAGFTLLTNVEGRYLGDPEFDPVWAELNRRRSVVFIHPNWTTQPLVPGVSAAVADFLLDTVRTAISLLYAGVLNRYRDVSIILSHAGGFLPYNVHRLAAMSATMLEPRRDGEQLLADARRFYFDTALSTSPTSLPSLLAFADPSRILYGTDWPYAFSTTIEYFEREFAAYPLTDEQRGAIEYGNARALFGW
ncbi:amidohydrolase family protein [Nocardioides sp. Bht2]|uniref:amidohydrolase family protein n=1 Tax=Nocardioides sp. Bht2 TaxID=3392297 RepID=UPI0039B5D684